MGIGWKEVYSPRATFDLSKGCFAENAHAANTGGFHNCRWQPHARCGPHERLETSIKADLEGSMQYPRGKRAARPHSTQSGHGPSDASLERELDQHTETLRHFLWELASFWKKHCDQFSQHWTKQSEREQVSLLYIYFWPRS